MISPSWVFNTTSRIIGYPLDLALLLLVFRRKTYSRLTLFFVYVIFLVPRDFLWLWAANTPRYYEPGWSYFYWTSEFLLCFLRLLVVIEIYWRVLEDYSVIRGLTWKLLASLTGLLFLWTGLTVWQNSSVFQHFITLGLQRMELTQTVLILFILGISVYYHIKIEPIFRWVLMGIFIYSAIQVANDEFGSIKSDVVATIFDSIRRLSFSAPQMIWTWAIWRFGGAQKQAPARISQKMYDEVSLRVHDRLRELNDRLEKMRRQPPSN